MNEVSPAFDDVDGQLTVDVGVAARVERVDTGRQRCAEYIREQVTRDAGVVEVIQVCIT